MNQTLKKFIPAIELLKNLPAKDRTQYLKSANPKLVKFLSDICYNILLNNLKLTPDLLKILKPHRAVIEVLGKKGLSLAGRRKILGRKNLFDNIFTPLIPLLIKYLS